MEIAIFAFAEGPTWYEYITYHQFAAGFLPSQEIYFCKCGAKFN